MKTMFTITRLVASIAVVLAAWVGLELAAPSGAAADGDFLLPGIELEYGGIGCRQNADGVNPDPGRVQHDFAVVNSSGEPPVVLDYRVSLVTHPAESPRSDEVADFVQLGWVVDEGPVLAVLESRNRIVGTVSTTGGCNERGEPVDFPILVRALCVNATRTYEVKLAEPEPGVTYSVVIAGETVLIPDGASRLRFQPEDAPGSDARIVAMVGNETIFDLPDIAFECEPSPVAISAVVSTDCRDAAVPGAIVVEVTNLLKTSVFVEVDVLEVAVGPIEREVFGGETSTFVRTGRRDGPYNVFVNVNGQLADFQSVEVDCMPNTPARAEVDWYCVDGRGVIEFTLTAPGSRSAEFLMTVPGLDPRTVTVPAGDIVVARRTGRPDGTYDVNVLVVVDGFATDEVTRVVIACAAPRLDVEVTVSCSSPRIVVTLTNPTGTSVDYSIDILEAEVAPLTGVLAPGETVTRVRTGRRDGTYTVETTSDGLLISSEIVTVSCFIVPLDIELSVSCESPRILIELTNVSDAAVAYEVDIVEAEVGPLTGSLDPGESVVRTRTGRSDGYYTVVTSADGFVVDTETIEVNCVAAVEAVNITQSCFGGNGVISATLMGGDQGGSTFVFEVTGLSPRTVRVAEGETVVSRRTGRPDGVYLATVTASGRQWINEITIACDEV